MTTGLALLPTSTVPGQRVGCNSEVYCDAVVVGLAPFLRFLERSAAYC